MVKSTKNIHRQPLKFALFGNEYQAGKQVYAHHVIDVLAAHGMQILVDKPFYEFLLDGQTLSGKVSNVFCDDDFAADFAISMGGDGTFLRTAARVATKQIPVIGVNTGRLGFLADVPPTDFEAAVDALLQQDYTLEEHALIEIAAENHVFKGGGYALNDIALLKRDDASMISLRVSVGGEYLATYQADGLVVSTPTGSTAYSLSNGGPIITPNAAVLCLTPVAPHSLNVRPIIVSDDNSLEVVVESRSHNFLVAVDGRSETLSEGTKITLRKAPYTLKTVKRAGQHYFHTLRKKMMWGVDQRQ